MTLATPQHLDALRDHLNRSYTTTELSRMNLQWREASRQSRDWQTSQRYRQSASVAEALIVERLS